MTRQSVRRRTAVVLTAMSVALASCGGSDAAPSGDPAAASRAYAQDVSGTTERARQSLATISAAADYRDAAAAAASTRKYAASIREAATGLASAKPPATIAAQHRALVQLYGETADRMEALALKFEAARDPAALTQRAQELSGEVQRYSSREEVLRSAIERSLAQSTTPQPTG